MNNKIKKHCEVTLLCCLCIGFVAGSNNLKIFRNVDGTIVEVSSKIEVPSDTNLTLICQVENIKNKGNVNGYVTWFIPSEIHSDLKLRVLKNSSNLVFKNVNIKDEGLYVCANLKFKIFKTLHLLVKQSKSSKPSYLNFARLTKRDILPGNGRYVFNGTEPYYNNDLTELKNEVAKMTDDLMKEIEKENKKKADELYNNNNYDINFNKHNDSHTNSFPVNPVALFFGVLFAVFVTLLLICLCGYMSQKLTQQNRNRRLNIYNAGITVPRPNTCGHTACSTNYLLNPAGACRFRDNILPTNPIMSNGADIERPLTRNTRNPTPQLDLPPTYASSAHNSTQNLNDPTIGYNKEVVDAANSDNSNLPPSYDEAVHLNATTSHDHNENRDYGFNSGVGRRRSSNN